MEYKDLILNKQAKITITQEYVVNGRVVEITDHHHIIQTSNGKVMEVENDKVRVEVKRTESVSSNV
jgi:Fe2+ or Zn2+ uptake regulation protein